MDNKKHIRPLYEQLGVENYYKNYAHIYENQHFLQIKALLERNAPRWDLSHVLDFCCGGGEVSAVLGGGGCKQITASDPFTYALYQQRFEHPCYRWDFQTVVQGKMTGTYSVIFASFALHLAPENQLFMLAWQLLQHSPQLVVITPHKRPALETLSGFRLLWTDFELTEKGKKVWLKTYSLA